MQDSGFDFGAMSLASTSYTAIMANHIGELGGNLSIGSTHTALLEATDYSAMLQMQIPTVAMDVAMPSAEALVQQMPRKLTEAGLAK